MPVIRKKLSEFELVAFGSRYDDTCECFQTTIDGGATWVDNPAGDPRTNPAFMTPETSEKCAAAQGLALFVEDYVNKMLTNFNLIGMGSTALTIMLFIFPPVAYFWRLAQLAAGVFLGLGATLINGAFTETAYEDLRDIFFCHLNEDGKFDSQVEFDAAGEDIQTHFGSTTINAVMATMYNTYGFVGFSNAAIAYAEEADCSSADCSETYLLCNRADTDHSFDMPYGDVVGSDWHPDGTAGFPYLSLRQTFTVPTGGTFDQFLVYWSSATYFGVFVLSWYIKENNASGTTLATATVNTGGSNPTGSFGLGLGPGTYYVQVDISDNGGTNQYAPHVSEIRFGGTEAPPMDGVEC